MIFDQPLYSNSNSQEESCLILWSKFTPLYKKAEKKVKNAPIETTTALLFHRIPTIL